MFDAGWTASLWSLNTRSEVRGFLDQGKKDLTGGQVQQDLSVELSDLATGSDREVVDSYRYLDELCKGLSARDATYPRILMIRNVRDLFAKALLRMKELPPDPREILHAKAPKTPDVEQPGHISATAPGVNQPPVALRERTARIHVKRATGIPSPPRSAIPVTTYVYSLGAEKFHSNSQTCDPATDQESASPGSRGSDGAAPLDCRGRLSTC